MHDGVERDAGEREVMIGTTSLEFKFYPKKINFYHPTYSQHIK